MEPLLSPFVLFIAKFNKKLFKEPKDEFTTFSNLVMIKPEMRSYEVEVIDTIEGFMQAFQAGEDPKELYRIAGSSIPASDQPRYKMTKCEVFYNND